jgi:hypothetical protein
LAKVASVFRARVKSPRASTAPGEDGFDFSARCETAFLRGLQPTVYSRKLSRGCAILVALKVGVHFKRNFGKLLLPSLRPGLGPLHRLLDFREGAARQRRDGRRDTHS